MGMLVMFVMDMRVFVFQNVVDVFMVVALSQMKPQADAHQEPRANKLDRYGVPQESDSEHCTYEGRQGEVSAGAGCSQMAKPEHEHHKADTHA